jgi:hypothetical protein
MSDESIKTQSSGIKAKGLQGQKLKLKANYGDNTVNNNSSPIGIELNAQTIGDKITISRSLDVTVQDLISQFPDIDPEIAKKVKSRLHGIFLHKITAEDLLKITENPKNVYKGLVDSSLKQLIDNNIDEISSYIEQVNILLNNIYQEFLDDSILANLSKIILGPFKNLKSVKKQIVDIALILNNKVNSLDVTLDKMEKITKDYNILSDELNEIIIFSTYLSLLLSKSNSELSKTFIEETEIITKILKNIELNNNLRNDNLSKIKKLKQIVIECITVNIPIWFDSFSAILVNDLNETNLLIYKNQLKSILKQLKGE